MLHHNLQVDKFSPVLSSLCLRFQIEVLYTFCKKGFTNKISTLKLMYAKNVLYYVSVISASTSAREIINGLPIVGELQKLHKWWYNSPCLEHSSFQILAQADSSNLKIEYNHILFKHLNRHIDAERQHQEIRKSHSNVLRQFDLLQKLTKETARFDIYPNRYIKFRCKCLQGEYVCMFYLVPVAPNTSWAYKISKSWRAK